jgi:bacteriorhodopsin
MLTNTPSETLMYIIPIAWIYVALMMAVAEATNTNGSVLGAIFTFLLYGVLPVALIVYFMATPGRKRALRAKEQAERDAAISAHQAAHQPAHPAAHPAAEASLQPDAGGHAAADTIAPVAEKP